MTTEAAGPPGDDPAVFGHITNERRIGPYAESQSAIDHLMDLVGDVIDTHS